MFNRPKRKKNNVCKKIHRKTNTKINDNTEITKQVSRCGWVSKDPLYIAYHDKEWGQPLFNSIRLFEMLCLEGQQAGLSWITVLKKRDHYRKLFHNFNPHKVAELSKSDIEMFLSDSSLIRHRGKLEAIVQNSKCYLKMESDGIEFSKFIWNFVNNTPILNSWNSVSDVPTQTEVSNALSRELKKNGFKYVGSTICYAFMQACGLVNDHVVDCICYSDCNKHCKSVLKHLC